MAVIKLRITAARASMTQQRNASGVPAMEGSPQFYTLGRFRSGMPLTLCHMAVLTFGGDTAALAPLRVSPVARTLTGTVSHALVTATMTLATFASQRSAARK